ncbi:MAG: sugar phosphate isomerase/epimerase family protein [Planctomycetota bacterium]
MAWEIGAFCSIDAGLGVHLEVVKELGIPTIQLHAPHQNRRSQSAADDFRIRVADLGIQVTAVFGGFDDESYESIDIVKNSVGLVPPESRASRLAEMKEISDFARWLGCSVVGLHLGFIPEDSSDPEYAPIVSVTRELCKYANDNGQSIHLETGQESAEGLIQFITDTGTSNLFINFDPANMILYGTGEPIPALQKLSKYVRSVHCKDATWSDRPGQTWGNEVPLGEGEVDIPLYLRTLNEIEYSGPLTIEREIPQDRERQRNEIKHASNLLSSLKLEINS